MNLDFVTFEQCQTVRLWRNEALETLRTPYALSKHDQESFYWTVVSNPYAPHRYWAIMHPWNPDRELMGLRFLGMGGLTYISWENRNAEISLIIDPDARGEGYGKQAVDLLLTQAFDLMGLQTVYGECYSCNKAAADFWLQIAGHYGASVARLPNRKFWMGKLWDSLYFSIDADAWRKTQMESHGCPVSACGA